MQMIDTPNAFNPDMDVEIAEGMAGRRTEDKKTPTGERQALSFEDIETWTVIHYAGRETMVTAKGDAVHPEKGNHIALDAMDREQPQRIMLHETWVDYWLDQRNVLAPTPAGIRRDT